MKTRSADDDPSPSGHSDKDIPEQKLGCQKHLRSRIKTWINV
jgi:hypothetical protein